MAHYENRNELTENCFFCGEVAKWKDDNVDDETGYPYGFVVDDYDNFVCSDCQDEFSDEQTNGKNERHASIRDYSHWNEEASRVKAQEDRYSDYYAEPREQYDY